MSDQNPNVELNKEEDKLIVENNSAEDMKNDPKAVKKPRLFYLSHFIWRLPIFFYLYLLL